MDKDEKLQENIILRAEKILQARLKRNKRHMIVMFACMNAANTYYIQLTNARAHHRRQPSV